MPFTPRLRDQCRKVTRKSGRLKEYWHGNSIWTLVSSYTYELAAMLQYTHNLCKFKPGKIPVWREKPNAKSQGAIGNP